MTKLALAFAVLAACSPPKRATVVADKPPGPTCEAVRDHLLSLLPGAEGAPKDKLVEIGERFRAHCTDDNWSVETRRCLADATADTLKSCADMLTQAQQRALEGDAAVGGGGGGGGTGAAPPPPAKNKSGDPCEGGQ
jgi:hypothetical protein